MTVDFAASQRELVAYLRQPQHNPMPSDAPAPRIALYRELLINNINGFLSSNFPVLRQLLADADWLSLVSDFFAHHQSSTPYFAEIPQEFLAYLQHERQNPNDLPFMLELAHYEWIEMALAVAQQDYQMSSIASDRLLDAPLSLSPLACVLAYHYPVHRIAPSYQPTTPPEQPTFLVVYRDATDEVQFLDITAPTYQLLMLIQQQQPIVTQRVLQQIVAQLPAANVAIMTENALHTLNALLSKAIIIAL